MRIELTQFLTLDRKDGREFYIKSAIEGFYIRRPAKEYDAYRQLSQYFRIPRVKLAHTETGDKLVVAGIPALSADKLLESNPELATRALNDFVTENEKMWRATARPMDESQTSRNWREESLKTAARLKDDPIFSSLAGFDMTVNGKIYPKLGETLSRVTERLTNVREKTMCLVHGDEHLANIIPVNETHYMIDPGNWTGYNTPSAAVNNIVGANHLFFYTYDSHFNNGRVVDIAFAPTDRCRVAHRLMEPVLRRVEATVDDLQGGRSLAREMLFVNCARVAMGWVQRSQDLTEVKKTGMSYLGIATERYYENSN